MALHGKNGIRNHKFNIGTFGVALGQTIISNFNIKPMSLHDKNGIRNEILN